jgi:hypothetical protein
VGSIMRIAGIVAGTEIVSVAGRQGERTKLEIRGPALWVGWQRV